ncbi:hypothetical protein FUA23_13465 [Neolewinella aurantiaca]|uniref:Uncharacterized protein n=1 Tax=Neolewinella aurantiaca TaxID=2602767 RepID=A0A5C7FG35_9BACT|nr:hypothetical protein [Neolewinella aurantiaca]TXF88670.1 hypothetical protein FUA23_13465 [Neolewinella aurantiaca]
MLHKARFVAYVNLVIFFLLIMFTLAPGILPTFVGNSSVSMFSGLFLLVMLVWGTINAFRFFRKPELSGWDKLFLLLAPVNLTYLLVVFGVLYSMSY